MGEDEETSGTGLNERCRDITEKTKGQQINELPDKQLLTAKEVALHLRVSSKTVYRWCEMGYLVSIKLNRTVRITKESVLEFVTEARDV